MSWDRQHLASTTLRGYGNEHQKERKRRLPLFTEHDPCGWCGQPLGPDKREWHLPHSPDRTCYLPGFWHAACNRSEGAHRGAARANGTAPQQRAQSRVW